MGAFRRLRRARARRAGRRRTQAGEATFGQLLFRHGVYVLPCGGGVIPEPSRAIRELGYRYGREGLIEEAARFLFESSPDECIEGTQGTALGILYHLGDEALFERYAMLRRFWLTDPTCSADALETLELVIGGLAAKLGLPCPEGVPAIEPCDEVYIFHRDT